jgi:charged multivesicular body protein 1
MQEVADEHGLEFAAALPEANKEALPEAPAAEEKKEDDLSTRLAALRTRS